MLFILDFANNTILPCFFFFLLIIDFHFLIPAAIAQIVNPIAELIIPTGISSKKVKALIEIHAVTVEVKISVQYNLELYKTFCAFYSSTLFLQENNFSFHLYLLI